MDTLASWSVDHWEVTSVAVRKSMVFADGWDCALQCCGSQDAAEGFRACLSCARLGTGAERKVRC